MGESRDGSDMILDCQLSKGELHPGSSLRERQKAAKPVLTQRPMAFLQVFTEAGGPGFCTEEQLGLRDFKRLYAARRGDVP